jgi:hypothetical protein
LRFSGSDFREVALLSKIYGSILGAALLLSACTSNAVTRVESTEHAVRFNDVGLMTLPAGRSRMEAAVTGSLAADSGCVFVQRSAGRAYIVWAGPVSIDDGGVISYAGSRFVTGQHVRFGGGFITETMQGLSEQIRAARCPGPYFLVQSVEEVAS